MGYLSELFCKQIVKNIVNTNLKVVKNEGKVGVKVLPVPVRGPGRCLNTRAAPTHLTVRLLPNVPHTPFVIKYSD